MTFEQDMELSEKYKDKICEVNKELYFFLNKKYKNKQEAFLEGVLSQTIIDITIAYIVYNDVSEEVKKALFEVCLLNVVLFEEEDGVDSKIRELFPLKESSKVLQPFKIKSGIPEGIVYVKDFDKKLSDYYKKEAYGNVVESRKEFF